MMRNNDSSPGGEQRRIINAGISENNSILLNLNLQCEQPNLTVEQLARIEENRRNALEKRRLLTLKREQQQQPPPPQSPTRVAVPPSAATECPSPDQLIRMERNRLEALARKKQSLVAPREVQQHQSSSTTLPPSSPIVSEEQRIRMEENRRKALEKKQRLLLLSQQHQHPQQKPQQQQCAMGSLMTLQSPIKLTSPPIKMEGENQKQMPPLRNEMSKSDVQQQLQLSQYFTCNSVVIHEGDEKLDSDSCLGEGKTLCANENEYHNMVGVADNELEMARSTDDMKISAKQLSVAAADDDTMPSDQLLNDVKSPLTLKKSALPPLPPDIQYDELRVLPIDDGHTDTLINNAELDNTLLNGWTLFDHQKEGIIRALRMRRLILAFDMGLGKTIIGCVWAKAFKNTFPEITIFVIAPPSLHEDWQRTATDATGLVLGNNRKKKNKSGKATKKNGDDEDEYELTVTGKRRKKAKKKKAESDSDDDDNESCNNIDLYIYSWDSISAYKDVILDVSDFVVIADEGHYMQSMETKRTKEALTLMSRKKCRGILLLTGTPMKNGRPSNLFPLLRAVQHPFGDNQKRYEFYFCNGQHKLFRGRETWDATGSSNLTELNAHIAQHLFRMTKEECLKLPPRKREVVRIPVPSRHKMRYTQALKDLAEAVETSRRMNYSGENDDVLSSFQRLRQISAIAKVDAIAALANKILVEEGSIVIFTTFVAVAKEIHQKLCDMDWAGELLTGETASKKRQAMVDRFQAQISPVFVATYGVGGVGLTLTAACTVVLVDRPWTPGEVCQAEDRVRRIGQKRPVRSLWISSFPIDEAVDEVIDFKAVNTSATIDGQDYGNRSMSAPKVSIAELVKSVLGNTNNQSNGR